MLKQRLVVYLTSRGVSVAWQHVHDRALSWSVGAQQAKNFPWRKQQVISPGNAARRWPSSPFSTQLVLLSVAESVAAQKTTKRPVPLRTQNEMFFVATLVFWVKEKPSFLPLYCFLRLLTTTTGFWKKKICVHVARLTDQREMMKDEHTTNSSFNVSSF